MVTTIAVIYLLREHGKMVLKKVEEFAQNKPTTALIIVPFVLKGWWDGLQLLIGLGQMMLYPLAVLSFIFPLISAVLLLAGMSELGTRVKEFRTTDNTLVRTSWGAVISFVLCWIAIRYPAIMEWALLSGFTFLAAILTTQLTCALETKAIRAAKLSN